MGNKASKPKSKKVNPHSNEQATSSTVTHLRNAHDNSVSEKLLSLGRKNIDEWAAVPLLETHKRFSQYAPFVGTIYDAQRNPLGMACLLEDGNLCTAMHVVCDTAALEKGLLLEECYRSLSSLSVLFIKNGLPPIWCNITDLIEDGYLFYGNALGNYDLAILKLDSPPNNLLADNRTDCLGFKIDDFDHFKMPYQTEPPQTIAISGPILRNTQGQYSSIRYFSKSSNSAGNSVHHDYSVTNDHPSTFGFSGMAFVGLVENNIVLYGINSYRDKIGGYQVGVKISEYLAHKKVYHQPQQFVSHRDRILLCAEYHALNRTGNRDDIKRAIRAFLNKLKEKCKMPHLDTHLDIVPAQYYPLDNSVEFSDDHQSTHMMFSRGAKKSFFYLSIGNNPKHKILNVLQDSISTIAHFYCAEQGIDPWALLNRNVIIDLGFNIGVTSDQKTKLSHVKIYGFPGDIFHIFPVDPDDKNEAKNAIIIDANAFLPKNVGEIEYPAASNNNSNNKAKKK